MSEKTNAWWGCRGCAEHGRGEEAVIEAAGHRRVSGHATYWEFHSKGSLPALRVVPAVLTAEDRVRKQVAPKGIGMKELSDLLGITWSQANRLRERWAEDRTFRVERRGRGRGPGGGWRVFP